MLNVMGGSLGNHMRNMKLQMKWQERKHKESYRGMSASQWVAEPEEKQQSARKEGLTSFDENRLQMIHQKEVLPTKPLSCRWH